MEPYINISSEDAGDLQDLFKSIKSSGFEIFDEKVKLIIADQISANEKAFIVKTKNPETLIKFTKPEAYERSSQESPFYGIALRPMEPYLLKVCDSKEYIDLAAYLELYMQMTEGKYIWFMKSHGF